MIDLIYLKKKTLRVNALLFFISLNFISAAQDIDFVRLRYDEDKIQSKQTGVTLSNDGNLIAFAYANKTIKVVNTISGKNISSFQGVHNVLFDIRILSDGQTLVSVGDNNNISFWNLKTGEQITQFSVQEEVTRIATSYLSNKVAFGTKNGFVFVYEKNKELKLIRTLEPGGHHVSSLDFDPNGKHIAVGIMSAIRKKNQPLIYDINSGSIIHEGPKGFYTSINYEPDGNSLILSGLKGTSSTWVGSYNIKTQKFVDIYKKANMISMKLFVSVYPYKNIILTGSTDKTFEVLDKDKGKIIYTTKREKNKLAVAYARMGIDKKRIYNFGKSPYFLVNYSSNNVNEIFNAETGKIEAYIYSDSNKDFVTVARDGRIDGNQEALSKIFWTERKSNKRVELESTFEKYYTPRLLPQIISSNAKIETRAISKENLSDVIANIPSISMSRNGERGGKVHSFKTTQKKLDLIIRIDSLPESVKEIRFYHNGKIKQIIKGTGASEYSVSTSLNQASGKVNYLYSVAKNKNGIESKKAKLLVTYDADKQEPPSIFAVVVGINNYKNPKYKLNYALADAKSMEEKVLKMNSSLFESTHVTTLYDDQATKENLKAKINEIANQMKEQDLFLFYYAGHGTMSTNSETPSEFYIVPYDVTQLYGNNEQLKSKAISASEIKEMTIKLNAQKQVFIIDACHSAASLKSVATRGAAEEKAIAQLARSTGTFWLTAAGSEQYATEFEEIGHGVFTYSILEVLEGKDPTSSLDGTITVRELNSYVEQRVPELSEQYKGQPQYPASFSFGNDFPIDILLSEKGSNK